MGKNHIVILNSAANEIESLLQGTKSMILRGMEEKYIPYGIVSEGDQLYFINENDDMVTAKGRVTSVCNSCCLSEAESFQLIIKNQDKLMLPDTLFYKWAGKKYLVLIGVSHIVKVEPVITDMSNMFIANGWCRLPGTLNDHTARAFIP